jgi:acetyl esterase/lipase
VPPGVEVETNLVFARAGAHELRLDLYRPAIRPGALPVVVWIHGGAFRMGSRDSGEGNGAVALANHGYAVAAIDYRLSQEATGGSRAACRPWWTTSGRPTSCAWTRPRSLTA